MPDEIILTDEDAYDETKTFAYKGDYLGMSKRLFLRKHDDPLSEEFSFVESTAVSVADFSKYDFETWMRATDRLVQYSATGTRLTIVDIPLKCGVFTFMDERLAQISLSVYSADQSVWSDLLTAMYQAVPDKSETTSVASIQVTSWKRPLGTMSVVLEGYTPSLRVRYVNTEVLPDFNRLCLKLTGSQDL